MEVFALQRRLVEDYAAYIRGFINIRDERVDRHVTRDMEDGLLWPEPLLQLNPSFEAGETIEDLVRQEVLHPGCARIFRIKPRAVGDATPSVATLIAATRRPTP